MKSNKSHIPNIESIADFCRIYGLEKPLNNEILCMKLENQPDDRLSVMPLYRIGFFRVIHFMEADLQSFEIDNIRKVPTNCLVFSHPSKLESWERNGKLIGNVVYFTKEFSEIDVTNREYESNYPFFQPHYEQIVPITSNESELLNSLNEEMIAELESTNEDKFVLIKLLLKRYLLVVKRIYNQKLVNLQPEKRQESSLFNIFRMTLDAHFQDKFFKFPTVAFFAEKLNMSANNLNMLIKKQTNKTASSFIQDKLLLEIKSYLIHTNLNSSEIAHQLDFENLSYFNRFFKKHTALTPLEYRRNHKFIVPL